MKDSLVYRKMGVLMMLKHTAILAMLLFAGCASAPYYDEARAERDYQKEESKRMHDAYRNQAGKK
jgi:hypothetical protein